MQLCLEHKTEAGSEKEIYIKLKMYNLEYETEASSENLEYRAGVYGLKYEIVYDYRWVGVNKEDISFIYENIENEGNSLRFVKKYKHRKNCECCPVSQLIVR